MTLSDQARQLLQRSRDLFARTHWREGEYGSWDDLHEKATFCSVGLFRALARGADPEQDPAKAVELAQRGWYLGLADDGKRDPAPDFYREGLIDLLAIVRGYDREQLAGWHIASLEDEVVDWNDEADVDEILDGLDRTLAVA